MLTLRPGATFGGRYEIVRPLSAGGMGVVYEVIHAETKRRRALKVMLPTVVEDADMRARFTLEATVTAEVESEHLVEIYDAGIEAESDSPFIVMELLRGEDLGARRKRGERTSSDDVLVMVQQTISALEKMHEKRVIHRDLKPENLFLTRRDDGTPQLKILDFGIAKILKTGGATPNVNTKSIGTPLYMAREQIMGEAQNIGPQTDFYALAHIVFTLLVGAPYFEEESELGDGVLALLLKVSEGPREPASVRASRRGVILPEAFDTWFARGSAVSPSARFSSGREMLQALRDALRSGVSVVTTGEGINAFSATQAVTPLVGRSNETAPLVPRADANGSGLDSEVGPSQVGLRSPIQARSAPMIASLAGDTAEPQSISRVKLPSMAGRRRSYVWPVAAVLSGLGAIAATLWLSQLRTEGLESLASAMTASVDPAEEMAQAREPPPTISERETRVGVGTSSAAASASATFTAVPLTSASSPPRSPKPSKTASPSASAESEEIPVWKAR